MQTRRRKTNEFAVKDKLSARTDLDGDNEGDDDDEEDLPEPPPAPSSVKKEPVTFRKVMTRSITGSAMIIFYLLMLRAGHFYCILVGVVTQFELFRELVNVRYVAAKEKRMPWFRTLQWGWFVTAMLWIYGEDLHKFCNERQQLTWLTQITEYLDNAVFTLYCLLFIATVLTLKQGLLRFQLSQFMWTVVIICITVLQVKYFAKTTLSGLFWFFFPMATVVMNDVSAYFCGISMGKKFIKAPLIAISPNKTWEGFIGAFFLTLIFSFYFPALLSRFKWIACPAEGIYFSIPPPLTCTPSPIFQPTTMVLPFVGEMHVRPIQLHGLSYGLFASLVAPFGGFFASAIKRAYNKKDFESFMPGHGGMMDRMDCQLLMMAFNSYYFRTFINSRVPSIQKMLFLASLMPVKEQVELVYEVSFCSFIFFCLYLV
jgi:phosphatidate cytidylyltransferase